MSGSIDSAFQFLNYKVDTLELKMQPSLDLVVSAIDGSFSWDIKLSLRQPFFFKAQNQYLGGVNSTASLYPTLLDETQRAATPSFVTITAGIVGVFQPSSVDPLPQDVVNNLVKTQIPAILFPYLRSAMSAAAAGAGFNGLIMPLINVQKWAQDHKEQLVIQTIENSAPKTN